MEYEAIIGMEVHAQLNTASKMFCGCDAGYASTPPNTHVCPVCLGMPGVLPVINQRAVEYTLMTALALNCEIPECAKFDRKNYPYPDLVKGYQISQYDMPFSRNGWISIQVDGQAKVVRVRRAHLEEDTGKLTHLGSYSLIDFNRSSVPLLEIVSEPDMRSGLEAWAYLTKLRTILRYLGVSTGNMEEGAMRCEVNISLRPVGSEKLGTYVEVKNLNSFRSVRQAIDYEIERQSVILDAGGKIEKVTMGWDENAGKTSPQRSKEEAHDYRYFPEPDLPPVFVGREWVQEIAARLPELPDAKQERFVQKLGLRPYDAEVLTEDQQIGDYFDAAVAAGQSRGVDARSISNWITSELFRFLKEGGLSIADIRVRPEGLVGLLELINKGTITAATAKTVLADMMQNGQTAQVIVEAKGLSQIADVGELGRIVDKIIAANPKPVSEYREGKDAPLRFLMGQVMRETRGKANPQAVEQLLQKRIRGE
jgi:aspartyl-tRNA(Asn)/glutamyl-tRNA(Gln) amidotransferase subunit B